MTQPTSARPAARAPDEPPTERRVSVRYQAQLKGSCQTLSAQRGTAWQATIRDISQDGIGLLLARRFEPGSTLSIELTDAAGEQAHLLLGRVAHATARPEGGWVIGCALLNPLSEEEIHALR